jgi:hypothetical protein
MDRRVIPLMIVLGLLGCDRGATHEPAVAPAPQPAPAPAPPPARPERRCLPLVIDRICTMPCSAATRDGDGTWHLEFWRHLTVRIEQVCGDAGCVETFSGEMDLGGACIARTLDPACHFDGASCVGSTREANWPPP